jgi:peptide/nickel transport system substrate-binding protein
MKKLFLLSLMLLLAASLILGSCAKETTTTTSTPATTSATTTTTAISTKPPTSITQTTAATTAPTTTAAPAPTGTLRATTSAWIETLDPNLQTTFEYALYDHVIALDEQGNYVPEVAESWSHSDDGLVWTLKIHKGIKFHNGDDLTSADVKFSIERLMKPGSMSPWIGQYSATIDHIDAPDANTVVITNKIVDYMFYTAIWGCPVVPKNYIEANGDENFNKHPIGSGPWKFAKLTPGVSIEFDAVPNHWRVTPQWAHLIVELIPESSTSVAKLKRGETDVIAVNLDQAVQVKNQGFELRTLGRPTTPVMCMLGTWATDGPLSDIKVRQALSLAINRQEVANTFFNGLAQPGGVLWTAPTSWGYDTSWVDGPWFKYDPAQAKALLEQAGYPDKFANPVITLYSTTATSWLPDFNLIISNYWEAVGVKTKVVPIDMGQLRALMYADPYPDQLKGTEAVWNMPTMQVSIPFLKSAIHSQGNWRLLKDTKWDALWASISAQPDPDEQIDLFRQTVEYMLDQYIVPGIVNIPQYYAVSPQIGDWTIRYSYDLWGSFAGMKKK